MKYFFKILLTLVLAVAIVFGMYYYTNGNPFEKQENTSVLTTVSKPAATEKDTKRELLASLPKDDYYLYKSTNGVVLKHNKKEYEFTNWSRLIDVEAPEMFLNDYDGDGEKELLIKAVSAKNASSGEMEYELYLLDKQKTSSGKTTYKVYLASKSTWGDILDKQIREEVRQLKSCKKIIQFAMHYKNKSLRYDKKTGIAKNGFVNYGRALQDDNGDYLTFNKWTKGKGIYSINEENEICVSVEVLIGYKKSEVVQTIGHINFKLDFDGGMFTVKRKTMNFTPENAYKVSDPRTAVNEQWSYLENNANKKSVEVPKTLGWIQYAPELSKDMLTQTIDLTQKDTDIKLVSKIHICESYIELIAKSGCTFDKSILNKSEYSVIINKGTDKEYEISYTSEITEKGKKKRQEVLRIYFDRAYARDEIDSILITYGSR